MLVAFRDAERIVSHVLELYVCKASSNCIIKYKILTKNEYTSWDVGNRCQFVNSEFTVLINEEDKDRVRDEKVYIIYEGDLLCSLFVIDAFKRAGARFVSIIIPYIPYARHASISDYSDAVGFKALCDAIYSAGANQLVTCELYAEQTQAFFKGRFINIKMDYKYLTTHEEGRDVWFEFDNIRANKKDIVIVSCDICSSSIAKRISSEYGYGYSLVDGYCLVGSEVCDKLCIIVCYSAHDIDRLENVVKLLRCVYKARNIVLNIVHLVHYDCIGRIGELDIDMLWYNNTASLPYEESLDYMCENKKYPSFGVGINYEICDFLGSEMPEGNENSMN